MFYGFATVVVLFINFSCVRAYNKTVVAGGNGGGGSTGDGGPAVLAQVRAPAGIWIDPEGDIFFTDYYDEEVREIDSDGIMHTVLNASTIPARSEYGICGDSNYLYYSDYYAIWQYNRTSGTREVYAGSVSGTNKRGDGGPATSAYLNFPRGLWLTTGGTLYVADSENNVVRSISPSGIINFVVGSYVQGYGGDGSPANSTNAKLNSPTGVYVDTNGVLYIADTYNGRIRFVSTSDILNTYAGGGSNDFSGQAATKTALSYPLDVKGDTFGNIYFVEGYVVRVVDYQSGLVEDYLTGFDSPL